MAGKKRSVCRFFRREHQRLIRLGRERAAENCEATMRVFMKFREDRDLTFDRLNGAVIEAFEAYLKKRALKRNTISYYMRCFRSLYNRAVERRWTKDRQPFLHVYTSRFKTLKRALSLEDIQAIKHLELSYSPNLDFSRDVFMFSFYTRGMPFVDMAYLRKENLKDGYLTYFRRKTGQQLTIEWLECMQRMVDKYAAENDSPFLLPIIRIEGVEERRQYLRQLRLVNRNLKKIADLISLPVPLSTYYARHSWATLARDMNVPLPVISEALGHDSETTTQIYLDSIKSTVVDSANRQMMEHV